MRQLGCVLCAVLCPPGLQACCSLISPPLSCPAQLVTWGIPGTLMPLCGSELALPMNEKAFDLGWYRRPGPSLADSKISIRPGGQIPARSPERCQAPALCPTGSALSRCSLSFSAGCIVNISSTPGRRANPACTPPCITKFGVEAFSDCLRYEMHPLGVKVCVVEPGNFIAATSLYSPGRIQAIATEMWTELPEVVREDYGERYFDEKIATMETIATAAPPTRPPSSTLSPTP